MWPGMGSATGWMAYLTFTPLMVIGGQLFHRARRRQALAGHDDYGFGAAEHQGGIVSAAALDRALLGCAAGCYGHIATDAPPMTLNRQRFFAL